jgi:hypothetical protein
MNPYTHINCKLSGSEWESGVCPACAWAEGYRVGLLKHLPKHNKAVLAQLGRAMAEGCLGYTKERI